MELGMDVIARRVVVEGRVQGVSFRAAAVDEAQRLGVVGWVANRPDGAVEALLEGSAPAVTQMLAWCDAGPSWAHVERVTIEDALPTGAARFEVRRSP